jgi:hypothetical protein
MQLSQETMLGLKITSMAMLSASMAIVHAFPLCFQALSFIDMVKYLFEVPGVKIFLSEKLSSREIFQLPAISVDFFFPLHCSFVLTPFDF